MATEQLEYEVVWTGTMEVARVRAEREALTRPSPTLRHDHTDGYQLILEFLALNPGATMRQIQTGTCLSANSVNKLLWYLKQRGSVSQSHAQQDDRSTPVRWFLVAE